jgi:hypothetical protein
MLKKSLVFGGIALVAFTLLILVGCPDVVSNGPTDAVQGDLTVSASAAAGSGDAVIVIQLSSGKFISGLATNATAIGKFIIKNPDNTVFNLGTNPTYKLNSVRTVFTITGAADADSIPTDGKLTVTIPKEAIDSSVVVVGGAKVDTSPIQVDIPLKTSVASAVENANAIVVTLSQGSFVSGITGKDFNDVADSVIHIDENSEVEVSADGRIATIFGKSPASSGGNVKVGIQASALVGYPVVTATDVTVSGVTEDGQRPITVSITPVSGDDFITIALNAGTFKTDAVAGNFTLGSSATGAVTGLQRKSGTKAVIKVGTPFTDATSFKLKIAAAAFATGTRVYQDNVVTKTTTKQEDVVVAPIDTSSDTENVLTITIVNGGKFVTSPAIALFEKTGTDTVTFTSSPYPNLSNNNTVAKITLSTDTTNSNTLGVTIDADAFDPDFLVELDDDDISLSLGSS